MLYSMIRFVFFFYLKNILKYDSLSFISIIPTNIWNDRQIFTERSYVFSTDFEMTWTDIYRGIH